jgi:nicotinamidase-related amidase
MDAARTALLVMDVQDGIVERLGNPALLERLATATAAARAAGVKIVYVVVGFRDGYPEISSRNRAFSQLAGSSQLLEASVHESVAPAPGEAVVTKRRVSAFAGSDLDVILRAYETQSLVLTGISTSGVVLSTLRQAADLDFDLVVLSDGCADGDHEVHRVLLQKVFPRQAAVMTVDEWATSLNGVAAARA